MDMNDNSQWPQFNLANNFNKHRMSEQYFRYELMRRSGIDGFCPRWVMDENGEINGLDITYLDNTKSSATEVHTVLDRARLNNLAGGLKITSFKIDPSNNIYVLAKYSDDPEADPE